MFLLSSKNSWLSVVISIWKKFLKNLTGLFLIFLFRERREIALEALKLLRQFPNTSLCEAEFSTLTTIKNKNRSSLKNMNMCARIVFSNAETLQAGGERNTTTAELLNFE